MRLDLTQREIDELCRHADGVLTGSCAWTHADAANLRKLAGEVIRLRDREAYAMHLHALEGAY